MIFNLIIMFFVLTDYLVFILSNEFKDNIWILELKVLYKNQSTTYNITLIKIYYTCECSKNSRDLLY